MFVSFLCASFASVGCSDDPEGQCTVDTIGTTMGCDPESGAVCAEVVGGAPACFAPVEVRGRVFDSFDDTGIPNATVVALDANGGAASTVVFTAADGTYALPVPVERNPDGTPASLQITLRSSAADYQTFPTAPRTALPIDLVNASAPASEDDPAYVVMNVTTDIALIPIEGAGMTNHIQGTVDAPDPGGVLVVAEQGGNAVSTAVSGEDGNFVLFNVPDGETAVDGYRVGVNIMETSVTVAGAPVEGVVLVGTGDGLNVVSGSLQFANPGACTETSVILAVASTFDPDVARGEAPAGLRIGGISNDASTFEMPDVPPGRYTVLAAFENDFCVRDPDPCIAGTEIQTIDVPGDTTDLAFKITGALATESPGADEIEIVSDPEPTLTWESDSSEDGYELRVYDAFGDVVFEDLNVPATGDATESYQLTGVTLMEGMIYQFRATSYRRTERCYISSTEDLRGVFLFDPTPDGM